MMATRPPISDAELTDVLASAGVDATLPGAVAIMDGPETNAGARVSADEAVVKSARLTTARLPLTSVSTSSAR